RRRTSRRPMPSRPRRPVRQRQPSRPSRQRNKIDLYIDTMRDGRDLSRPFPFCRHVANQSGSPGQARRWQASMSSAVSPLAPKDVPDMPEIAGVRLATAQAGIRYKDRTDVLLVLFDEGTTAAGVFTRSKCPSAPVEWCRANLKGGKARALVVNSGNANAFTGKNGREACKFTAQIAARAAKL